MGGRRACGTRHEPGALLDRQSCPAPVFRVVAMREKSSPGAVERAEVDGDQVRDEQLPDTTIERSGPTLTAPLTAPNSSDPEDSGPVAEQEDDPNNPLPWLANFSLTAYETM